MDSWKFESPVVKRGFVVKIVSKLALLYFSTASKWVCFCVSACPSIIALSSGVML